MLASVFVAYDGALDPLGGAQIVPYLECLSRLDVRTTLVSFEKPERLRDEAARKRMEARLAQAGIAWEVLRYHKTPRLQATLWDVARGARVIARVARDTQAVIVHGRGDVAMAMVRAARLPRHVRLVYEARGLFADERVEVGSWPRGGLIDRTVRSIERANLAAASGLLCVMAPPGLEALRARVDVLPPYRLLPNSVDLSAFRPREAQETPEFGVSYHGSLGGWYLTAEIVAFLKLSTEFIPGRPLVLTQQLDEARRAGVTADWAELRSLDPQEVPAWLRRARASCFFIQPSPAKRASSPTKFAEALASGLPVIANGASGELDHVLEQERVGVLTDDLGTDALRTGARRLAALLEDPQAPARCRALAETRYSLEAAAAAYYDLYSELVRA
jgi:glycosyltransferase involved in cell wall biosynthesis